MKTIHLVQVVILSLFLGINGCSNSNPLRVPTIRPVVKMKARIYAVPDYPVEPVDNVEVPDEYIPLLVNLITPIEPCQIDRNRNFHFADVTATHADGTNTTLEVRWTGNNPAAISLDGVNYYYGGTDEFPDGATRILRILNSVKQIRGLRSQ